MEALIDLDIDDDDNIEYEQQARQLFSEHFALKGSSYHEDCQKALRECKNKEINNEEIQIRVTSEPTNPRDKNAMIVESFIANKWQRVGYIPRQKIKKLKTAMLGNEIQSVQFKFISHKYIPDLNDWLYCPVILITKYNNWLPTNPNYKYNDPI